MAERAQAPVTVMTHADTSAKWDRFGYVLLGRYPMDPAIKPDIYRVLAADLGVSLARASQLHEQARRQLLYLYGAALRGQLPLLPGEPRHEFLVKHAYIVDYLFGPRFEP